MLGKHSLYKFNSLSLNLRTLSTMSIKTPPKVQEQVSNAKEASSTTNAQAATDIHNVNHSRYHEKYTFLKDFASPSKNIYTFPEGGFQEVSLTDIDKYLPEGLSHGVEEVLNTNNNSNSNSKSYWMIRESSKLLCRLVDEVQSKLLPTSTEPTNNIEIVHRRNVHIPLLTDREEWSGSVLQVSRYGNPLVNATKKTLQGESNYVHISKQGDCAVDACLSRIYEEVAAENKKRGTSVGFPDKILLTGKMSMHDSIRVCM